MPSIHLILWCLLLLLPSIFPSIKDFSNESAIRIRLPKYWSFTFSVSPSNVYSGLISLKIDWFDLFAVQGTLRSLLQHYSSKASILWCSVFLMVQLSQPYMTTGNTIALTIWNFVSRVMSLLFNTLSRFVIVFLPRSKRLLISWLQSLSAVIFERKKSKSVTASTFSPSICHEVMGLNAMILVFFFFNIVFKPALSHSSFTLIKNFSSFSLSEKAMAPHSSTLAWKIPWMEEPGGLQSMGSLRVGHDWATSLSLFTFMHWRRRWQPIPVFLPGESQGWDRTESDTTEVT